MAVSAEVKFLVTDADRERLKRIAYGRDATAKERSSAEESLRKLAAQDLARASVTSIEPSTEPGIDSNDEPDDDPNDKRSVKPRYFDEVETVDSEAGLVPQTVTSDPRKQGAEKSLWRRRIRIGWLVPIALGAFILGSWAALGTDGQREPVTATASPTPSGIDGEARELRLGDLVGADGSFAIPFSEADSFPYSEMLEYYGIDAHGVRATSISGVWIGRTDSKLCLLLAGFETNGAGRCVDREQFALGGIHLRSADVTVSWYGGLMIVDVDTGTKVTESGTPVPPVPEARPGNVDVANALFDQPATARDFYPITGMLDQLGVDQSHVRLLVDDDSGHLLWAVKQGTVGFCLASYDVWAAIGHSNCATIEEFEASGVSIVALGFSAWWGGAGLEMRGSQWLIGATTD